MDGRAGPQLILKNLHLRRLIDLVTGIDEEIYVQKNFLWSRGLVYQNDSRSADSDFSPFNSTRSLTLKRTFYWTPEAKAIKAGNLWLHLPFFTFFPAQSYQQLLEIPWIAIAADKRVGFYEGFASRPDRFGVIATLALFSLAQSSWTQVGVAEDEIKRQSRKVLQLRH